MLCVVFKDLLLHVHTQEECIEDLSQSYDDSNLYPLLSVDETSVRKTS